jgi:hypothetical protein
MGTKPTDSRDLPDTDIVEHYIDLSKQLDLQYRQRRGLEWRMHVALWALLAGVTYLCVTEKKVLGDWALLALAAIPLHAVWTIKIVIGQIRDQDLSEGYRRRAESLLLAALQGRDLPAPVNDEERSRMPEWVKWTFQGYFWWPFVQLGTTSLLSLALVALTRAA